MSRGVCLDRVTEEMEPGSPAARLVLLGGLRRSRGFSYSISERLEIVAARALVAGLDREPHNLPAPWGGQPLGVGGAQVITVRLGMCGQRAKHGR
jgi:hypothetical protein